MFLIKPVMITAKKIMPIILLQRFLPPEEERLGQYLKLLITIMFTVKALQCPRLKRYWDKWDLKERLLELIIRDMAPYFFI